MGLNDVTEGGGGGTGLTEVDTATITLTSGNTPAFDSRVDGITGTQTKSLKSPDIYPDPNSSHPSADFGANFDTAYQWDESAGQVDLLITGNWDTDPGSNVTYKVEVNEV